jgi:hypothetical protein
MGWVLAVEGIEVPTHGRLDKANGFGDGGLRVIWGFCNTYPSLRSNFFSMNPKRPSSS